MNSFWSSAEALSVPGTSAITVLEMVCFIGQEASWSFSRRKASEMENAGVEIRRPHLVISVSHFSEADMPFCFFPRLGELPQVPFDAFS